MNPYPFLTLNHLTVPATLRATMGFSMGASSTACCFSSVFSVILVGITVFLGFLR
jgi:hypothetical protein